MATQQEQDWSPCPTGELSKMIDTRRARKRRKVIDRCAVVLASVMGVVAIGGFALGLFTPDPAAAPASIACSEVLDHLPDYVRGTLDDSLQQRMAAHLDHCPSCHSHYEELRADHSSTDAIANAGHGRVNRRRFAGGHFDIENRRSVR